jgi:hypothetical protein
MANDLFSQMDQNKAQTYLDQISKFNTRGQVPTTGPGSSMYGGAGGGMGGMFDKLGGLDGVGDMMGIVGDLGGIYASLKGLGIAKDQLKFQKSSYNTNVENQTQTYNTALEDRTRARHKAERTSSADTDQYLSKNSL